MTGLWAAKGIGLGLKRLEQDLSWSKPRVGARLFILRIILSTTIFEFERWFFINVLGYLCWRCLVWFISAERLLDSAGHANCGPYLRKIINGRLFGVQFFSVFTSSGILKVGWSDSLQSNRLLLSVSIEEKSRLIPFGTNIPNLFGRKAPWVGFRVGPWFNLSPNDCSLENTERWSFWTVIVGKC